MAQNEYSNRLRCLGFRVSGYPVPGKTERPWAKQSDDFELEHVATAHARRLEGLGWQGVQVHARMSEYGAEFLKPVNFRTVGVVA